MMTFPIYGKIIQSCSRKTTNQFWSKWTSSAMRWGRMSWPCYGSSLGCADLNEVFKIQGLAWRLEQWLPVTNFSEDSRRKGVLRSWSMLRMDLWKILPAVLYWYRDIIWCLSSVSSGVENGTAASQGAFTIPFWQGTPSRSKKVLHHAMPAMLDGEKHTHTYSISFHHK